MGKKKKKTKRTCLRCDRDFMSEGIFNRICPNCRESNANIAIPNQSSASELTASGVELATRRRKNTKKISD